MIKFWTKNEEKKIVYHSTSTLADETTVAVARSSASASASMLPGTGTIPVPSYWYWYQGQVPYHIPVVIAVFYYFLKFIILAYN